MKKNSLESLNLEQLKQKKSSVQVLMGIFVPIILALSYFCYRDYQKNGEWDFSTITIIICSIGGMVTLYPTLKSIKDEINRRQA